MRLTHGHWKGGKPSKVWTAHRTMLTRCYHQTADSFPNYQSKGVSVCDRWRFGENGMTGFECFASDVGMPPSTHHSIDRIKNNKGYMPGNVRWATAREQALNRSSNRMVTAFGKTMPLREWCREKSISEAALRYRLFKAGNTPEKALSAPMRSNKRSGKLW